MKDGFTVDRAFEVAKEIMNDESLAGCSSVRVTLTINDEYEGYVVELFNDFNESGVPDSTIFDEESLTDFYADMVADVETGR